MPSIEQRIAQDIAAKTEQVRAAVELLDGGATVPFIARYRKEVTGGLDDTQLRTLEERLRYLRELEDRRAAILSSVEEQGKLTDALKADILAAETKATLEDLYTCPTSPSAAPRRRSPARPGWSRWRPACAKIPRSSRRPSPNPSSMQTRVWVTCAPRSMAPARY
jgi:hypothetical protein